MRFSSPFARHTPVLVFGLQKISYEFSRFANITLLLWVHVSLADVLPLVHWQEHPAASLYSSKRTMSQLSPALPAVCTFSHPSWSLGFRWAVSGCNFKWPCAQNKCRHSAVLKNQKSLNACYRNFFCVLVVKLRAVLNIYWISVTIPKWYNSTSLNLIFFPGKWSQSSHLTRWL